MQNPSCVCDLHHSSQRLQILNPLNKTRDWTCFLMDTSQVYYHWAMTGMLPCFVCFECVYMQGCVCVCILWPSLKKQNNLQQVLHQLKKKCTVLCNPILEYLWQKAFCFIFYFENGPKYYRLCLFVSYFEAAVEIVLPNPLEFYLGKLDSLSPSFYYLLVLIHRHSFICILSQC